MKRRNAFFYTVSSRRNKPLTDLDKSQNDCYDDYRNLIPSNSAFLNLGVATPRLRNAVLEAEAISSPRPFKKKPNVRFFKCVPDL